MLVHDESEKERKTQEWIWFFFLLNEKTKRTEKNACLTMRIAMRSVNCTNVAYMKTTKVEKTKKKTTKNYVLSYVLTHYMCIFTNKFEGEPSSQCICASHIVDRAPRNRRTFISYVYPSIIHFSIDTYTNNLWVVSMYALDVVTLYIVFICIMRWLIVFAVWQVIVRLQISAATTTMH